MENKIISLITTLNKIEIHGKQNLDMMLGCIQVLENMLQEIRTESRTEAITQEKAKEVNTDG